MRFKDEHASRQRTTGIFVTAHAALMAVIVLHRSEWSLYIVMAASMSFYMLASGEKLPGSAAGWTWAAPVPLALAASVALAWQPVSRGIACWREPACLSWAGMMWGVAECVVSLAMFAVGWRIMRRGRVSKWIQSG